MENTRCTVQLILITSQKSLRTAFVKNCPQQYPIDFAIRWACKRNRENRVSPISTRLTFEELAVLFEGSTASGAERAYRKAVEHLACLLTEAGVLHIIRLKHKSQTKRKKKIAAAVYLYQVDNDGEWGEVSFDFETETTEIIRLAEWDTTVSKKFAKRRISPLRFHHLPRGVIGCY